MSISVHASSSRVINIGRPVWPVNSIPHTDIKADGHVPSSRMADRLMHMQMRAITFSIMQTNNTPAHTNHRSPCADNSLKFRFVLLNSRTIQSNHPLWDRLSGRGTLVGSGSHPRSPLRLLYKEVQLERPLDTFVNDAKAALKALISYFQV